MAKIRPLARAPISEALIDIRTTLPKRTRQIEYLAGLDEQFRDRYPDKKTIQHLSYRFNTAHPQIEERTTMPLGFRYTNAENTQVIQATLNGFTFSRLPPYQDWPKLREEAMSAWNLYSQHLQPESHTRVAVRYINKLNLPGKLIDFDDYLCYCPVVPKALPQTLGAFLSRIVVPDERGECIANITQSYQPSFTEITVIIDIEVFREKVFTDADEAWETLDRLRGFKNLIFFDSITEKTAKLYE